MKEGQWYPGVMARALSQLRRDLNIIDLVVEVADARIPAAGRNPVLSELAGKNRKQLLILHKSDQADQAVTGRWLAYYRERGQDAMPFSVFSGSSASRFLGYLKKEEKAMKKGRLKRPLRLMMVGIPNVGKSTLINYLVKRTAARTGNRPGITRGRQWIRILGDIELLDTPGILQPRVSETTKWPLAAVGAIPSEQFERQLLAQWLIDRYLERGMAVRLVERYRNLEPGDAETMFEQIGLGQGCLQAAGKIDPVRTAMLILRDFQGGALGRITLENPPL